MRKLGGVRVIDVTGRSPDQVAEEIDGLLTAPARDDPGTGGPTGA
jgi:hypothetical protein